MIRWWGKFLPQTEAKLSSSPAPRAETLRPAPAQATFSSAPLPQKTFQPSNHVKALFADLSQQRIFALTVGMFGNPSAAATQHFFQYQVPQIVALLRTKPTLMKDLALACEKMPPPFGALTGIACGANALPDAMSGLAQVEPIDEELSLQALRRIYPFNPKVTAILIEQLGLQGTLNNRLRVLELVLTSQVGNRDSINALLAGIAETSSPAELNQSVYPRLLALIHKAAPSNQQLAFKQGWLANCLKGWLGEELENGRLSSLNAVAYRQRFDPKA